MKQRWLGMITFCLTCQMGIGQTPTPVTRMYKVTKQASGPVAVKEVQPAEVSPLALDPSTLTVQTFSWSNVGCDVGWGGFEDKEMYLSFPAGSKLEYCTHSVAVTNQSKGGFTRPESVDGQGVRVWYRCVGGPFWDQYGASVKMSVTLGGVPQGTSNEDKKRLGCRPAPDKGTSVAACIRAGSPQSSAIGSCLKGPGACYQFPDLLATRCVKDQQEANWFFGARCSNEFSKIYDYLFVADSPQCK